MAEPILIVAPSVEPVTLAEAKVWCRIDHSDDDAMITALIVTAREECEHRIGRRIIDQQWDVPYDAFPLSDSEAIKLPFDVVAVSAIVQIAYLDTSGSPVIWSSSNYALDPYTLPGYVVLLTGKAWPTDVADSANAVKVRVKSGFGANAAAVPEPVKTWIKAKVAALYDNRSMVNASSVAYLDEVLDCTVDRYTVMSI
jgi:uncharacterized phiE125 gp8 family phage protein